MRSMQNLHLNKAKRLLLLGNDVSTKYTRRGPEMYRKYAEYMMRVIKGRTGNYLAFFPSYRFLEEVWEVFMELPQEQIEVAVQSQYMTEQEQGRIPEKIRTGKSTQPDRLLCDGWYFFRRN